MYNEISKPTGNAAVSSRPKFTRKNMSPVVNNEILGNILIVVVTVKY